MKAFFNLNEWKAKWMKINSKFKIETHFTMWTMHVLLNLSYKLGESWNANKPLYCSVGKLKRKENHEFVKNK